jgi:hypothetical protein
MRAALVDYCVEQKLNGKSYSELKNELALKDVDHAEIMEIIKIADRIVIRSEVKNASDEIRLSYRNVGFIIAGVGIAMTIGSLVYSGGDSVIIMIGPISAGIGAMMAKRG